jgi:hypothetical protein
MVAGVRQRQPDKPDKRRSLDGAKVDIVRLAP